MMLAITAAMPQFATAEITKLKDRHPQGNVIEYWRLTHDPAIWDHANCYHTNCFSPDGRYVCYTHHGSPNKVHLIDLHTGRDIELSKRESDNPCWANKHNWLFFTRSNPGAGEPWKKGTEVMRYDCDTGEMQLITWGMRPLGSTDCEDRWIYGNQLLRHEVTGARYQRTVRARIAPESPLEVIYENQFVLAPRCNPRHEVIFMRDNERESIFGAARLWIDLDGSHERIGVPLIQRAHINWSGDGEWQLIGDGPPRFRRWNEPFPSDIHLLTNICTMGDISPCGKSGRWICGDYGVVDLRSGDGTPLPRPPSVLCLPAGDGSLTFDPDPKGSADGTKICFVSTFDLQNDIFTRILNTIGEDADSLLVTSTEGFPESGDISVLREVVGYKRKTPTSFEGLERHKYHSGGAHSGGDRKAGVFPDLQRSWPVTSFDAKRMTPEERKRARGPSSKYLELVGGDRENPLLWQKQTDVYMAVVRLPDPPHLRTVEGTVQLIPGENHWETFGYYLERDGERLNEKPLRPGSKMNLRKPGIYRAVAEEWSGLQGKKSLRFVLKGPAPLTILAEKPKDFSWTRRVWRVEGKEVAKAKALAAAQAGCEIRHLHDGVIRREDYRQGQMVAAEDLNAEGKATRRLTYVEGRLATREHWTPEGRRIALEKFGPDGFKTEDIRWRPYEDGKASYMTWPIPGAEYEYREHDHWFFDHGWPVKRVDRDGRPIYEKRGDDWVQTK